MKMEVVEMVIVRRQLSSRRIGFLVPSRLSTTTPSNALTAMVTRTDDISTERPLSEAAQQYNASIATGGAHPSPSAPPTNRKQATSPDPDDSDATSVGTSEGTSDGTSDSDDEDEEDKEEKRLAKEEYERMISQTKLIVQLAIPFLAGYYGRRFGFRGEFFPYTTSVGKERL
jgi:hypothetical protein